MDYTEIFEAESTWLNPLTGTITGYFGDRENPILGTYEFHNGLDIGASENTEIIAVKDGVITEVGVSRTYGNYLYYTTYDNYEIMYAHLNKSLVETGDEVTANDVIALVGTTGLSTGFHLHYTIMKDGEYIDPLTVVDLPLAGYLE